MRSGAEGRPFSILFRGCSALVVYEAGVFAALRDVAPDLLTSASKVYGSSSGSIVATVGLCGCNIDELMSTLFQICENSYGALLLGGRILPIIRNILNNFLPLNAHQLVSGKLHIILTRVRDCRNVVVSEFASREDLIQAIICSCFIPLYFGLFPPKYQGVRYIDGEVGMWQADFVSRATITVSGFAGEYDICPRDGSAAFFTFRVLDCILGISKRNICRLMHIFKFPSVQVMDQLYTYGYQDTVSFLERLSAFGINYLDDDFMLRLANKSRQKGEGTLPQKPETKVLHPRATDSGEVTQENSGTVPAAAEVEEDASHHLLHHQKVWTQNTREPSEPQRPVSHASEIQRSMWWSPTPLLILLCIFFFFLCLSTIQNWSA